MSSLAAGVVVERCPFLVVSASAAAEPPLRDYVFLASNDRADVTADLRYLALGWGSLFNHDDAPNLSYAAFPKRRLLEFITVREVTAGEQLFVSYGGNWWKSRGVPRAKGR